MRIALLGPTYPHRGGIAHYTTLLARAVHAAGHEVAMVSFSRLYPGFLFPGVTQLDESGEALAPPVTPERLLDSMNPISWIRSGLRLREVAPDLLVVPWWHPFFGPSLGTAARVARQGERPRRIFLCHNVEPHEATILDQALAGYGLGAADGFLVHARAEAERLRKRARGRPIRVHPHPSYEVFSEKAPSRDAARATLHTGGKILLFFGYVRPYKGLVDLLEALRIARPDAWDRLYVVGEFYEPRRRYEALLQDPALRDKVIVVDRYVANEEVATYFAAADAVVLPYRSATGSGIAQMAFGAGVPVIATRTGGLEDVVEDGVSGLLVEPAQPAVLGRAIERYFDEGLSGRLREGVARARPRFTWSALVDALVALGEECR